MENRPLTTGEAAKYCHVAQATIVNWIRDGKIKAYATPGGHYRIPYPDFMSFLKAYQMPVDSTLRSPPTKRILVASDRQETEQLVNALQENVHLKVNWANNEYEIGLQMATFEPQIIILDAESETFDVSTLCQYLHPSNGDQPAPYLLAIGQPECETLARDAGVDAYLTVEPQLPKAAEEEKQEEEIEHSLATHIKEHIALATEEALCHP